MCFEENCKILGRKNMNWIKKRGFLVIILQETPDLVALLIKIDRL